MRVLGQDIKNSSRQLRSAREACILVQLNTFVNSPLLYERSHTHTLTRSHTHTLTRSHTHTLTHSHTYTLTHSHTHTLTHSHTYTLTHSHAHTLTHLHTHTLTCSHTHMLTHSHAHTLTLVYTPTTPVLAQFIKNSSQQLRSAREACILLQLNTSENSPLLYHTLTHSHSFNSFNSFNSFTPLSVHLVSSASISSISSVSSISSISSVSSVLCRSTLSVHLVSSASISSRLRPSRLVCVHLVSSASISSRLRPSRLVCVHLVSSALFVSPALFDLVRMSRLARVCLVCLVSSRVVRSGPRCSSRLRPSRLICVCLGSAQCVSCVYLMRLSNASALLVFCIHLVCVMRCVHLGSSRLCLLI